MLISTDTVKLTPNHRFDQQIDHSQVVSLASHNLCGGMYLVSILFFRAHMHI